MSIVTSWLPVAIQCGKNQLIFFIDANTGGTGTNIDQTNPLLALIGHQAIFCAGHRIKNNVRDSDVTALQKFLSILTAERQASSSILNT